MLTNKLRAVRDFALATSTNIAVCLILLAAANAAESDAVKAATDVPDNVGPWSHFVYKVLGNTAVFESIMIYIFGIFVVSLEYILLKRANAHPEAILRVFTITLIIVLSLTVLNSGSDKTDFTPIIGLFGTIIGYMLGSSRQSPNKPNSQSTNDSE